MAGHYKKRNDSDPKYMLIMKEPLYFRSKFISFIMRKYNLKIQVYIVLRVKRKKEKDYHAVLARINDFLM